MIRNLVKELKIFERNEVLEEIKILGIAIYFQTFRRTARILSELHPVSYNAVRRWIKEIGGRLPIAVEKKKSYCDGRDCCQSKKSTISFIQLLMLRETSLL